LVPAALLFLIGLGSLQAEAPTSSSRPRLAVLVVFDQLRGDYLSRWDSLFGDDGFHRLEKDGVWFENCHYPYADTVTAAGHASLLTGCSPAKHGVIDNDWYDRAARALVNCVESDRYQQVPAAGRSTFSLMRRTTGFGGGEGAPKKNQGVSPERLLMPTLGDVLKGVTGGKGKVVSLSFKDRSAVLPAGRRADGCYWLDVTTGTFVTSTYYRDRLPSWLAEFNSEKPADHWFGRLWTRLRPGLDYAKFSGPDDVAGEGLGVLQGRTFPHPFGRGILKGGMVYYGALYNSPFGNELLLELTKRAIAAEDLGGHDDPDLLCVSFSCNDPIGHCWGPDSQEVLDVTLRSDRIVQELLAFLDARLGKGRYILALTADHGVCPLPEVSRSQGKPAERVQPNLLKNQAEAFLEETYGQPGQRSGRWIEAMEFPWIYLNREAIKGHGLKQADVEEALVGWLKERPMVQTAYSRAQIINGLPKDDTLGEQVRRSFYPSRSGDVTIILKPYHLCTANLTGTHHGTPHAYDTHVPLLVFGPGIQAGTRQDAVTPQAIAAIFARSLDLKLPAGAEAPVPRGLFQNP
jgi:hypothetical protein